MSVPPPAPTDAPADAAPAAPAPVLTGGGDGLYGGDWKRAPQGATDAWYFALAGAAVFTLATLGALYAAATTRPASFGLVFAALCGVFAGANWYLVLHIRKGTPEAWPVQIVLSVIGLIGFPILTLLHVSLLSKWFQKDTKAWFGQG